VTRQTELVRIPSDFRVDAGRELTSSSSLRAKVRAISSMSCAAERLLPQRTWVNAVSFADLRLPNVDAVLEAQIAAAGGRFRGIRQIAAHDPAIIGASSYVPPPGLMDDPNFRRA
jgi:L-fuconolactonase